MKKYLYLQLKRTSKLFPFVLAVTLVFFIVLAVVFGLMMKTNSAKDENTVFKIGLAGDTDDDYMQLGVSAVTSLDQSRFTMEMFPIKEAEAEKALARGEIAAYVVFPENFMENALSGDVEPVRYVTTTGNRDVMTLFKNEITTLITEMVVASEKGTYGLADAINKKGQHSIVNENMTNLTFEYVELMLHRSDMAEVEELGISNGLTITKYYACSFLLLFIMLIGLPFATLYIKDNRALQRLLISKGYTNFTQQACEYLAHLVALVALCAIIFAGIGVSGIFSGKIAGIYLMPPEKVALFALNVLPTLIMVAAFNLMIFELSSNMVGGVLLHFFSILGLCYISGCFYPISAFPKSVQQLSRFLPVGIARQQLSSFFTQKEVFLNILLVLCYAVLFFAVALFARRFKTVNDKGGRFGAKTA